MAISEKFPAGRSSNLHSPFESVFSVKFSVTPFSCVRFISIFWLAIADPFSSLSYNIKLSPSVSIELLVMDRIVVSAAPEFITIISPMERRRMIVTHMITTSLEFIFPPQMIFLIILCLILFFIFSIDWLENNIDFRWLIKKIKII